jgi:Protein of unknown function (DUF3187)
MAGTKHTTTCGSSRPVHRPGPGLRFPTLAAGILAAVVSQAAEAPYPFYLRNANPLLQTLGTPAMQGGELTPDGTLAHRWVLNMANHADASVAGDEEIVLDGESYFLDLALRYGLGSKLELGLDLPLVAHTGGVFDGLIEGWHDLVGLSNFERSGPDNELRLFYQRNGITEFDVDDPGAGLGDVRLSAAYSLVDSNDRALAMRVQAELPTGDTQSLRGNGAVDLSLVLDATDRRTFAGSRTSLFGRIGLVAPGDGDILNELQEDWVPLISAGLVWQWTEWTSLQAQVDFEGAYFETQLQQLGSSTRLTVGGSHQFGEGGPLLSIALIEDLVSDATPDFGLYFSLTMRHGP